MVNSSSGNIRLIEFSDTKEYTAKRLCITDQNLIIIDSSRPVSGFRLYPTKIEFILHLPASIDEYWNTLPSNPRSNLRRKYDKAKKYVDIEIREPFSLEEFLRWYEGYKKEIESKNYGKNVIKDPLAYFQNHNTLLLANVRHRQSGNIIGGSILSFDSRQLRYKLAWYNNEAKKHNASYLLILECIHFAIDKQCDTFSFGADTNLYGGHLSLGLHQFKAAFHTTPIASKSAVIKNIKINSSSNFEKKPIIFYVLDQKTSELQKQQHLLSSIPTLA